jgi:hypothetical protein
VTKCGWRDAISSIKSNAGGRYEYKDKRRHPFIKNSGKGGSMRSNIEGSLHTLTIDDDKRAAKK